MRRPVCSALCGTAVWWAGMLVCANASAGVLLGHTDTHWSVVPFVENGVVIPREGEQTTHLRVSFEGIAPSTTLLWIQSAPNGSHTVRADISWPDTRADAFEPLAVLDESLRIRFAVLLGLQLWPTPWLLALIHGRPPVRPDVSSSVGHAEVRTVSLGAPADLGEFLRTHASDLSEAMVKEAVAREGAQADASGGKLTLVSAESSTAGSQTISIAVDGHATQPSYQASPGPTQQSIAVLGQMVGRRADGSPLHGTHMLGTLGDRFGPFSTFQLAAQTANTLTFVPNHKTLVTVATWWAVSPLRAWLLTVLSGLVFVVAAIGSFALARFSLPKRHRPNLARVAVIGCLCAATPLASLGFALTSIKDTTPRHRVVAFVAIGNILLTALLVACAALLLRAIRN